MISHWWCSYFDKYYSKTAFANGLNAKAEVNFILSKIILNQKSSVLDMCCGSGAHAHEYAKKGYNVVGVDYSKILIENATSKITDSENIKFIQSDMRVYNSPIKYDLVCCIGGLGYFNDPVENQLALLNLCDLVDYFGYIVIEVHNQKRFSPGNILKTDNIFPGRLLIHDTRSYNLAKKGLEIKRDIYHGQDYIETSEQYIQLFSSEEIEEYFKSKNIEIVGVWGSYEGDFLDVNSEKQICIGRRGAV